MGDDNDNDREAKSLKGQAEIYKYMFGYVDAMALKCAVELHVPDIINSHGGPISLAQIAAGIPDASSPDSIPFLERIMRLLVRRNIFAAHRAPSDGSGGETLYGLTHSSSWLLRDTSAEAHPSLAPFVLLEDHPLMMAPWHCLGTCVKQGGVAFKRAHGKEIWDFASENSEFNKLFNAGMECMAKVEMGTILAAYKDGFGSLRTLVDVGGGTGGAIAEIVKTHPRIEGINLDLPHVIATASARPGVRHVGGDMFESIPNAEAVFMKWIMHDWSDEDCVKILKNCRKAIPEKSGKIIIVEVVLEPQGNGLFDDAALVLDLVMLALCSGGKERTQSQWENILNQGGFPRYNIIKIPALQSIIEAYPV